MIRPQYHFRTVGNDVLIWDVIKLIQLSEKLPIIEMSLTDIKEIDSNYWYADSGNTPTCRSIVEHIKLINDSDLSYPIILAENGSVMDGMHRVCKALWLGKERILVKQFEITPEPDFKNKHPDELTY